MLCNYNKKIFYFLNFVAFILFLFIFINKTPDKTFLYDEMLDCNFYINNFNKFLFL